MERIHKPTSSMTLDITGVRSMSFLAMSLFYNGIPDRTATARPGRAYGFKPTVPHDPEQPRLHVRGVS